MEDTKVTISIGGKSMDCTLDELRNGIIVDINPIKIKPVIPDIKPADYVGQYSEIYPDVLRVYIPGADTMFVDFSSLIGGLRKFCRFVLHSPNDTEFTFIIPIPTGVSLGDVTKKVIGYFMAFGIKLYDVSARNTIVRAEDSGNGYTETIKDDVEALRILQDYIKNNPKYFMP